MSGRPLRDSAAVLGYLGRVAVRSPSDAVRLVRAMGATVLDAKFAATSPFPELDAVAAAALQRHPFRLPPLGLMAGGNQDLRGLAYLVSLERVVDARCIFEIGTFNGFTALTLALNLPSATVHTLDLPHGRDPGLRIGSTDRGHIRYLEEHPRRVYEGTDQASRIVQHLEDSATFDFTPFRSRCDLVYVDGAHSVEYVKNDSEWAFAIAKSEGVIVWDDYERHEPGVAAYLDEDAPDGLFRLPGSRLVAWLSESVLASIQNAATEGR